MEHGALPNEEILRAVEEALSDETVRPLTDRVRVLPPETLRYDIDITYYIPTGSDTSASVIERAVATAVESFKAWQGERMGRDINPSRLTAMLMETGIKRVEVRAPVFTPISDGRASAAEVALIGTETILSGGYEDE